jgi:GTP1/Obg family GTP-binding protein
MKQALIAAAVALPLTLAPSAFAQQPQMPAATQQAQVTDEHLETFADIYVDMQKIERDLAEEIAAAGSTEDAQQVHRKAEVKMIGVIEDHGWTVDQYNTVAEAINTNDELRVQAVTLINARS